MHAVLLTIHTLIVLALVGVVLLQRSEGGALGMGGGGGGGGLMSGRGAANALTRTTTVLGAAFFLTSLVLAITSERGETDAELLERTIGAPATEEADPADVDLGDLLDETGTTEGEEGAGDEGVTIPEPEADALPIPDPTADAPTTGEDTAEDETGEETPQR